ncbi:unnamed protein product, partial [Iphiclides podalirius]
MEWDQKKNICDRVNELKVLNDTLKKENFAKERQVPTKDAVVMTEESAPVTACGEVVPAQERAETNGHHQLDVKQKASNRLTYSFIV